MESDRQIFDKFLGPTPCAAQRGGPIRTLRNPRPCERVKPTHRMRARVYAVPAHPMTRAHSILIPELSTVAIGSGGRACRSTTRCRRRRVCAEEDRTRPAASPCPGRHCSPPTVRRDREPGCRRRTRTRDAALQPAQGWLLGWLKPFWLNMSAKSSGVDMRAGVSCHADGVGRCDRCDRGTTCSGTVRQICRRFG